MTNVLAVFVDALKPESLKHMGFLSSLHSKRIKTELGYSNTCHASMYTGVYPDKHQSWFIWRYHPEDSPYKVLSGIGKHKFLNDPRLKFLSYLLLQFFRKKGKRRQVAGGFPLLVKQPMSNWGYFDADLVSFFHEPNDFIGGYPTIFRLLRDRTITVNYKFCSRIPLITGLLDSIISRYPGRGNRFDFVFLGEIDAMSHKYGQDAPQTVGKLKLLDNSLEKCYRELKEKNIEFSFILWSDHGHVKVENSVDLYALFDSEGRDLTSYIHFVDSSFARFWFRDGQERRDVEAVLSLIGDKGYILTEEVLKEYHVNMPHSDYGELIFYLDRPNMFSAGKLTLFGKDRVSQVVSHHSYLPDYPDMDGIFIANRAIRGSDGIHVRLEDICPSILRLFSIKAPEYMDGEVVWSR